jgi:hypothetical protein
MDELIICPECDGVGLGRPQSEECPLWDLAQTCPACGGSGVLDDYRYEPMPDPSFTGASWRGTKMLQA